MSYISESLSRDEHIIKIFPHHYFVNIVLCIHIFICVITAGMWAPIVIYYWLKWKCTEQGITNKRVIYKSGIISRSTKEMRLNAFESVQFSQGIIGRIFGFGKVVITGRGAGDVVLHWMENPLEVKKIIEATEYEQTQASLQTEKKAA